MAAVVVPTFTGMFPRRGTRLLDDTMAAFANNAFLTNGYVRGRNGDKLLATFPFIPERARRVTHEGADGFLTFITPNVDIVSAPLVNDSFNRLYWAGEGIQPGFNTAERIVNGDLGYRLGVMPPQVAPSATNQGGGAGTIPAETRLYVFTYVDEFGQESQPSPVSNLLTIRDDETARIVFPAFAATPGYAAVTKRRLYRTVPGQTQTSFFFVADLPVATTTFDDDASSKVIALNNTMESATWATPPDTLAGMVVLPNGFLAGFSGRDLLFSEAFRPHAWPVEYTLSVDDDIVGLAVFDTNVVVLTTGVPYMASGVNPEAMSLVKVGPTNACVARRSIVAMPGAVLYASEDGINAITVGGNNLLTRDLIGRDEWRIDYKPEKLLAARDGDARYVGFFSPDRGFMLDFKEVELGITFISTTAGDGTVVGIDEDSEGRSALLLTGDGKAYTFSAATLPPEEYVWRSKEFFLTRPLNFGAGQINIDNTAVPFGISEVRLRLWADGLLKFDNPVQVGKAFRLPTGYKAQVYQFELQTKAAVSRVVLTETPRELAGY
jgi:hypothetical protein